MRHFENVIFAFLNETAIDRYFHRIEIKIGYFMHFILKLISFADITIVLKLKRQSWTK
jgi:hypothetical protein